jgi:tetratricopeptide (TPR) repeat protein
MLSHIPAYATTDPALVKLFKEGLACQSRGDLNAAVIAWKRIQRQFPDFADAWTNASTLLSEMGRSEEALDMALRAVELDPENPLAIYALASARLDLGCVAEAKMYLHSAIERDPRHFLSLAKLADIHAREGNFTEALRLYDRAIQIYPSLHILWLHRSKVKLMTFDMAGAEEDLLQVLKLDPNYTLAHMSMSYILPLQGRYREGWVHVNALYNASAENDFGKPNWNGEPLDGRTLLIYSNNHQFGGFGDVIQFARFFPYIKQNLCTCDGRLLLFTYGSLKRLMKNLPGIDGIFTEGEPLPDFDVVTPVDELPSKLNIDLLELPPPTQILPECLPMAMPELDRPGFKIGLVWAGSSSNSNKAIRDMSPVLFDELSDIPGIAWYGLQKPSAVEPPKLPGFIDMSPHMGDFMDTAKIARQLDLIVTVDTSMTHLAGSLGLPTIVLLPYLPDWRWGLNSQQTNWYPTVTLFRQPAHNDWKGTVSLLKQRIIKLATPRKRDAPT